MRWYIIQSLYVSDNFVSLRMGWELELHNRLQVGFALGWSYYSKDQEHEWSEINLYIGLIGITLKY